MGAHETKTFKSGNSEAVRLPKEFAFGPGTPVTIERTGDVLTIRRSEDPVRAKRKLRQMLDELRALPKPDYIEKREPFEFPDRPGQY